MASGTTSESPRQELPRGQQFVQYERFIDDCVRRTGGNLKWVDLAGSVLKLTITLISLLVLAALLDHWVVPGGLGSAGRWAILLLLIGVVGHFLLRRLWPIVSRRINPEFAAQTIEQSAPGLKNTLLNFLMFRRDQTAVSPAVYEAIEEQAAVRLSDAPVDLAVDRDHLVRLGRVLVAAIVVLGLYSVISPKNPWQTAARVLMPLAEIQTPSRVEIFDLQPADREIYLPRGDHLTVSARVQGVDEDDPVTLVYSTTNSQHVDRPLAMYVPRDDYRYACRLPDGDAGIQQDLRFRIEAGDAVTATYYVRVTAAPTISVESIHYEYPAYTGFASRRVVGQGDLRAIEGTRVTIRARANTEIESAYIDFDCDDRNDLSMRVDGRDAQASFTLDLDDDRRGARHDRYQLWFTNRDGHKNRQPVQYTMAVIRDEPPEIELAAPREREIALPINGSLDIEIVAKDPDFALAEVAVQAEVDERSVFERVLLEQERIRKFRGKLRFVPQEYALQVGDVVSYWATAQDNKSPEANRAETDRREIRIVAADPHAEPQPEEQDSDKGEPDASASESGEQGSGEQQGETGEPDAGEPDASASESGEQGSGEQQGETGESDAGEPDASASESGEQGSGEQQGETGESDAGEPDASASESGERGNGEQQGETGEPDASEPDGSGENGGQPTPSDGTDDGSAFEKIRKYLEQQSEGGRADSRDESPAGDEAQDDTTSEEEGQGRNDSQQPPQPNEPADDPASPNASQAPNASQDSQGEAGTGEDQPGEGSPEKSQELRPDDKQADGVGEKEPTDNDNAEPPPPALGSKESDSRSDQSGEKAGDGEKGDGQRADRQGKGSAGQSEAADKGSGQADEPGEGDAADQGGKSAKSDKGETGEPDASASESGEPDAGEPDASASESGEPSADNEPGEGMPSEKPSPDGAKPGGQQNTGGKASGDQQPAGGQEGDGVGSLPETEPAPADKANQEYARKVTDLVLERLEDQVEKDRVDPKLLDKLGWTKEQMRRFVERWQKMRRDAQQSGTSGTEARGELDAALRSLGLRDDRVRRGAGSTTDAERGLRGSQRRSTPAELQEQLKAYLRGTNRDEGE